MSDTKTTKPEIDPVIVAIGEALIEGHTSTDGTRETTLDFNPGYNNAVAKAIEHVNPEFPASHLDDTDSIRTLLAAGAAHGLKAAALPLFKKSKELDNVGVAKLNLGGTTTLALNVERKHVYPAIAEKDGRPGRPEVEKFGVLTGDYTFQGSRVGVGSLNKIRSQLNVEYKAALSGKK